VMGCIRSACSRTCGVWEEDGEVDRAIPWKGRAVDIFFKTSKYSPKRKQSAQKSRSAIANSIHACSNGEILNNNTTVS
jgi:Zn-finger nucleic acid-binding protein